MKRPEIFHAPTHWSKDFAEHLRTVHFTLIGISTGLILLGFSAKPYNSEIALREIHQILELKEKWASDWMPRKGTVKLNSDELDVYNLDEAGFDPSVGNPDSTLRNLSQLGWDPDADEDWKKEFPISAKSVFEGKFDVRGEHYPILEFSIEEDSLRNAAFQELSPNVFPSTLADFQRWWDVLQTQPYQAIFPRTIAFDDSSEVAEKYRLRGLQILETPITSQRLTRKVPLYLSIVMDHPVYWGRQGARVVFLPVRRFVYTEVTQQMLAKEFKCNIGPFKESFSDLSGAADKIEELRLDEIEKIISGEASKGGEVLEAFGMKFPAGQITVWGTVILSCVQLYFFLYLRQLSGKRGPSDAAWDVPWIAMDTSWLGRIIFFATVVVLPVSALALLAGHQTSTLKGAAQSEVWAIIGPSIILGVLCWKYRPKLQALGS